MSLVYSPGNLRMVSEFSLKDPSRSYLSGFRFLQELGRSINWIDYQTQIDEGNDVFCQ
jgi:hypothetical protein